MEFKAPTKGMFLKVSCDDCNDTGFAGYLRCACPLGEKVPEDYFSPSDRNKERPIKIPRARKQFQAVSVRDRQYAD